MKKIFTLFIIALLISSCLPQDMQVPQSPLLPLLERKSGLIAYIGVDWNIYTSDQAGKNITAYTNDALIPNTATDPFHYYSYPAWSPDSASIGFIGVSGQGTQSTAEPTSTPEKLQLINGELDPCQLVIPAEVETVLGIIVVSEIRIYSEGIPSLDILLYGALS